MSQIKKSPDSPGRFNSHPRRNHPLPPPQQSSVFKIFRGRLKQKETRSINLGATMLNYRGALKV
jgi:hypothetical protein